LSLPSAKDLKQLAKACRAVGITSFEGDGIKFTLGPIEAAPSKPPTGTQAPDLGANEVDSDELSQDALLFWSTGGESESQENA